MGRNWVVLLLILAFSFSGFSSVSATPPAKIVSGVVSNVVSALIKWLWSLKSSATETVVSGRSMMKFEGGYTVETVFDGSKLGIDPYSVEVSPAGELLVLDSESSNIYRISTPLSRYSRPKLIAGSPEGYSGHVDGRPREARMNHPKGITADDRGNIYVADTLNMAIRKISDAGKVNVYLNTSQSKLTDLFSRSVIWVVTIAGGKWGRGGGHVDGPSEDAKFSNDFDVTYIGSSCSLLVVDRGNQAIREIQLHEDDCTCHDNGNLHLGLAVLAAAAFFGYMLALLQRRVSAMLLSHTDPETSARKGTPPPAYQRPVKSVRPPLIPAQDEYDDKPEEGLFGSLARLIFNACSAVLEIFTSLFFGRKKPPRNHLLQQQQHYHQQATKHSNAWPMQESFVIPDEDEPPSIETRSPTSGKAYQYMPREIENHQFKRSRSFHGGWNGGFPQQAPVQQQQQLQQQQHHQRHYSSTPQTYYEQSCETNEIVFGAVQEQDGRREAVVIKAVDYSDPMYNNHNIRSRYNYMGYSYGY